METKKEKIDLLCRNLLEYLMTVDAKFNKEDKIGMKRSDVERLSLEALSCVTGGQIYSFLTTNNTTRYCFISRTGNIQYTDELPTPWETAHLISTSITRCLSADEAERSACRDFWRYSSTFN